MTAAGYANNRLYKQLFRIPGFFQLLMMPALSIQLWQLSADGIGRSMIEQRRDLLQLVMGWS